MTAKTNQQGAPEALRTITRYEVVDCIDSKHVPAVIPNKDGPWVRYEDHIAAQAEQQATKETSGGFHVWRDISTAPKDGSRFVATGRNYGLYSETQHTCIAQWFRGCWMEVSDWNEASELKYLTHWMPLPPLPGSAASATADSVLEDAARYEYLRDCTMGERNRLEHYSGPALDVVIDAARKQGGV